MKIIGIVCNKRKDRVTVLLQEIKGFLKRRGIQVLDNFTLDIDEVVSGADLIIALGGDGTLLNLANRLLGKPTPVMGVNLGSLGFITDIKVDEICAELEIVLKGQAREEDRFMLEVSIDSLQVLALNDVVIHRENASRFLKITLEINEQVVYSVSGDGIILATPTGSTGYNLSAGGPVVHPTAENIIVTPICHHSLVQKSIVLAPQDVAVLTIESKDEGGGAKLIVDGQTSREIVQVDRIQVKGSDKSFRLIRNSKRRYFDVLKEKFGWII